MKQLLKKVISQSTINNFYHLPKAVLANWIYVFPTRKLKVIGVTGTDGKTTAVNMIYQILKAAGKKVSMVSTVNAEIGGETYDTGFHVTSPDPFMIQKFANSAKHSGDEYLVLEVTSHALDQYRFWGIKFDVGVITNITHEHLDYHKTFENYSNTKIKLIEKSDRVIINQNLTAVVKVFKEKLITFGLNQGDLNQKEIKLKLRIPGDYNLENALAALAVAFVLGIDKNVAQRKLEEFSGVEGRMEEISSNRGIKIIIDFAHTPNALEQALKTLKKETKGRLIAIFGSAGKRDIKKRSLMGEISKKLADFVIITSEDPRGQLQEINQQIKQGVESAGGALNRNFFIIDDRKKAIDFAINSLGKKGDTIAIFGKGHEKSINLDGKREIPWSDFQAVKSTLENG